MAEGSRPHLVEITGIAGSGKSTLIRYLCRNDADFSVAEFIHTRKPEHLAHVAHSLPRLLPILTANVALAPRLSWPDVKLLVYVTEWRRFLEHRAEHHHGITLLDQGPMYALVRLKAQAKGVTRTRWFERWWNQMLEGWAAELAAVVYLDAADRVLWDRINQREQSHATKGEHSGVGERFIDRYRGVFEDVLDRLDVLGGPQVLRFDTSATTGPEQVAAEFRPILAARGDVPVADAGGNP